MNVDMGGESASQQVQLDEIKCRMVELPHEEAEKATTVSGDEARVKVSKAALGRQLGQDEVRCFSENVSLPGERRNKYLFLNKP